MFTSSFLSSFTYLFFLPSLFVYPSFFFNFTLVNQHRQTNRTATTTATSFIATLHSHLSTFPIALEIIIRFDQEESTDHRTRPGSHFFFFPSLSSQPFLPPTRQTTDNNGTYGSRPVVFIHKRPVAGSLAPFDRLLGLLALLPLDLPPRVPLVRKVQDPRQGRGDSQQSLAP